MDYGPRQRERPGAFMASHTPYPHTQQQQYGASGYDAVPPQRVEGSSLLRYGPASSINQYGTHGFWNLRRMILALAFVWIATFAYLATLGRAILAGMENESSAAISPRRGAPWGSTGEVASKVMRSADASSSEVASSSKKFHWEHEDVDPNNVTVSVLIVYGPQNHAYISEMAWQVAMGVRSAFVSHKRHHPKSPIHGYIHFGTTSNLTFADVVQADAVIVGSPVYNGNTHPVVQEWINYWKIEADLSNKVGSAFVTAGGMHAGADGTLMSLLRSMMVFRMIGVGGDSWDSPFGAAATMHEDPFGDARRTGFFDASCYQSDAQGLVHPYFLHKAFGLGERVANVTLALRNSTYWR